jgi:hypothetical protein
VGMGLLPCHFFRIKGGGDVVADGGAGNGLGCLRRRWGGAEKCIGDNVVSPWRVPDIGRELGDEGQLPLLTGSPRRRNPVHGVHKGLDISPKLERSPLKKEPKVPDALETCQQLPVEGGIFGLC